MSLFIESNVIQRIFRRFWSPIDINEGIDIPMLQQFISREIVMGKVRTDVFWVSKGIAPKIIHSI